MSDFLRAVTIDDVFLFLVTWWGGTCLALAALDWLEARVRFAWRYFTVRRRVYQAIDTVIFEGQRYDHWARSHAEGPRK